ncbi:MAG: WG repeat-containing protein [Lewinellaceae bacterium]|nr:WG repeat-containing protein [Lewinellaceae bacterium]
MTPEDDEGLGCEPGLEVEIDKNSPESKLSNSFEIEYRQGKSHNLAQLPERLKPLLSFSEGLIKTQDVKYRKWGFLDKRGRIVVEFQYSDVGIFKEELAPFRSAPNELWGILIELDNLQYLKNL